MEKQQLIVQSRYSQLNGEVKTLLGTDQFNYEFETVLNKKQKIVYHGTTLDIDKDTYIIATDNAQTFYARYDGGDDNWKDSDDNDIDLATYGITLNGQANGNDVFIITNNDGNITYDYYEFTSLFFDDSSTFDYVAFFSSSPIEIQINKRNDGEMLKRIKTRKVEIYFNNDDFVAEIVLWNYTKQDVDVNLILAKKVKNETI